MFALKFISKETSSRKAITKENCRTTCMMIEHPWIQDSSFQQHLNNSSIFSCTFLVNFPTNKFSFYLLANLSTNLPLSVPTVVTTQITTLHWLMASANSSGFTSFMAFKPTPKPLALDDDQGHIWYQNNGKHMANSVKEHPATRF